MERINEFLLVIHREIRGRFGNDGLMMFQIVVAIAVVAVFLWILFLLKRRNERRKVSIDRKYQTPFEGANMKKCPYCAEEIQGKAVVCRFCRFDLKTGKPIVVKTEIKSNVGAAIKLGIWMCFWVFVGIPLIVLVIVLFGSS